VATSKILFEQEGHKVIKLTHEEEEERGGYIGTNQYLIIDKDEAMLLDPGGRVMFPFILDSVREYVEPSKINYIFLSHQDPDVASSLQEWSNVTPAKVVISKWWIRFVSLFGISDMGRIVGIEDRGGEVGFASGRCVSILPAHFLHSPANLCVYDPTSKILFSGDIGAAVFPYSESYDEVADFDKHKVYMEGFHKRYMASQKAIKAWIDTVSQRDIDMIAPQHGAVFGRNESRQFLEWLGSLECGVDIIDEIFR